MQKYRGLFHLRVYESAEGVAWFASFQRKRTYYLPWNFYFLMQIVKNQVFMKHFLLTLLLTFIVGVCSARKRIRDASIYTSKKISLKFYS